MQNESRLTFAASDAPLPQIKLPTYPNAPETPSPVAVPAGLGGDL